jgi:hypothetical protein
MAKKITFEDVKFNYELAYGVYVQVKENWNSLSKTQKSRARRQIEGMLTEAGFRGNKTGLVSKAALETIINKKKGIKPVGGQRTAVEHPITHKNVAEHILSLPHTLSFQDYIDLWFTNLVTTITTADENMRLKHFQKDFVFGVDCWKEMYETAGVELIETPKLNTSKAKKQYGII